MLTAAGLGGLGGRSLLLLPPLPALPPLAAASSSARRLSRQNLRFSSACFSSCGSRCVVVGRVRCYRTVPYTVSYDGQCGAGQ